MWWYILFNTDFTNCKYWHLNQWHHLSSNSYATMSTAQSAIASALSKAVGRSGQDRCGVGLHKDSPHPAEVHSPPPRLIQPKGGLFYHFVIETTCQLIRSQMTKSRWTTWKKYRKEVAWISTCLISMLHYNRVKWYLCKYLCYLYDLTALYLYLSKSTYQTQLLTSTAFIKDM